MDSLQRSGCQFRIEDLMSVDWLGLEALREGREMAAKEAQAEREKEKGHREA